MVTVKMLYSELTTAQVETLFSVICEETQMKSLGIGSNKLSSVEPPILVTALNKLEVVDVWNTGLTRQQVEALFTAIARETRLKKLGIGQNNLYFVEPAILATVVSKLKNINLYHTHLTNQQLGALFTSLSGDTQLKTLVLSHNKLSSVEPSLLATAVTKLEIVEMRNCHLTNDQVASIKAQIIELNYLFEAIFSKDDN